MKTIVLIVSMGLVCSVTAFSQNDIDAMRYSQLTFGGTARFTSMAGSMGALGGDISTLSFNPAGIAVFRKNEISVTPSLFSQTTSATFNGNNVLDRKLAPNLGNIGLVTTIHLKDKNNTGWQSLNFGIGYNRTNNFNNRITVQGYNKTSSLLDNFVSAANGHTSGDFDQFSTGLAYQAYLFNPVSSIDSTHYNHVIPNYGELQKKSTEMSGTMGETDISFGANYKDKVFLGGSLGIANIKYREQSTYEEIDDADTIPNFNSFKYTQYLNTSGYGVNLKLGVILKPVDWLRIGAAIHTPTKFKLTDNYSSSMDSDLGNGNSYSITSPKGSYNYTITTPWRAIGSLGFVVDKIALFNIDYEFVDYTYAQLGSKDDVFGDVNNTIRNKYTQTGNLRVGGELRLDPIAFRLGYAYYGSPFKAGENANANHMSFTGGIGYRLLDKFVFDIAYVFTTYTDYSYLYDSQVLNPVQNKYTNSAFMFTVGIKF